MTTLTSPPHCGTSKALECRIDDALRRSTQLGRHRISLETKDGCVVLRGVVKSYFQKQIAQEVIRRVDGVHRVDNRLEVLWSPAEREGREPATRPY